jgi:hypothetical protein
MISFNFPLYDAIKELYRGIETLYVWLIGIVNYIILMVCLLDKNHSWFYFCYYWASKHY